MPVTLADTLPTDADEREYLWTLNFGPQRRVRRRMLRTKIERPQIFALIRFSGQRIGKSDRHGGKVDR